MRFIFTPLLLFILTSCASQKNSFFLQDLKEPIQYKLESTKKGFDTYLEIIPNKSLLLKKDEFGMLYGNFIKGDSILIKYQFKKKKIKNVVDDNFIETLYFTTDKTTTNLTLENLQLSKINMVLQRQCYCKGTAGFFKITNGNFNLNIKKNELTLTTDFSIKNIPHVLTKINEKVIFEH